MIIHLNNKKVLISGASRGIGESIKDLFELEGAAVYHLSRTTGTDLMKCNLDGIMENLKNVDILINNFGGGGRWGENMDITEFNEWEEVYKRNVGITRYMTMKVLPHMIHQNWGRVITISSIYGTEAGGLPWFTVAKSGQIVLMKELARHYNSDIGITFNCISPCPVKDAGKKVDEGIVSKNIADLALFLCSEHASNISGQNIVIDKGKYTRSF